MEGIRGFANGGGLSESTPFERLGEADALALARDTFGAHASSARRLDTERDDSFHLRGGEHEFVLKVAHPEDRADAIDLQTSALRHAAETDAGLPLQRVHRSVDGELAPLVGGGAHGRIARLLDWLPGTPLFDVHPDAEQLAELGRTLARLARALRGLEHPAAARPFVWDALQAANLQPLLEQFPNAAAEQALNLLERDVLPYAADLPHQVIHNDFHPGNVLVDAAAPGFVVGILDFGDVVWSARVADLAITSSYLLAPGGHSWHEVETFLAGYASVTALSTLERSVTVPLTAARFAQRILINSWLARGNPGAREAIDAAVIMNTAALTALLEAT